MPSWQSILRIGCPINNPARRARGATPPTRLQWTRVPLDFRPRWRYVVDKAGAANAAPALKYKFYFTPHFGGYTEFGIVPIFPAFLFSVCTSKTNTVHPFPRSLVSVWALNSPCSWLFYPIHHIGFVHVQNLSNTSSADPAIVHL